MRFKMDSFYILLYRVSFVLKNYAAEGVLRQWPGLGRWLDRLKQLAQRHFLRTAHAWVRIQSGLSQGLWIQIRVPGEIGFWRGDHEPEVQNAILAAGRPRAVG